jgi:RimJ/RimL family protein N-acetyltransferase
MVPEHIKTFREMVTLKDGAYILLRPMVLEDEQKLIEYYAAAGDEDLRYFRDNVRDRKLIQSWCDNLDYEKVLPLLAFQKDRIVGSASLHFFTGPKRHVGEMRLFLAKDFRKRGLGMKMIRAMIDIARKQGLSIVTAEIIAEFTKFIKAFEQLGFKTMCIMDDYFMFPDGDFCDTVLMKLTLRARTDEF